MKLGEDGEKWTGEVVSEVVGGPKGCYVENVPARYWRTSECKPRKGRKSQTGSSSPQQWGLVAAGVDLHYVRL